MTDEAKKAVECLRESATFQWCSDCYASDDCGDAYKANCHYARIADLIESLAAERDALAEKCRQLEARNDTLIAKEVLFDEAIAAGAKMQRERDAYFESMKGICATCKKAKYCMLSPLPKCPNWQWRGVKED